MRFWKPLQASLVLSIAFFASCQTETPQEKLDKETSLTPYKISFLPDRDTIISAPKGTLIFIEKGSFQLEDGSLPTDPIDLEIKEAYSTADMVREKLTTQTDTGLLISGGMVYLNASSNGRQLKLNKGKEVVLHFPKSKDAEGGMSTFYGDTALGNIKWRADAEPLLKLKIDFRGWSSTYDHDIDMDTIRGTWAFYEDTSQSILSYFDDEFDINRLKDTFNLTNRYFHFLSRVTKSGAIGKVTIEEKTGAFDDTVKVVPRPVDPYFYKFFSTIPRLWPQTKNGRPAEFQELFVFSFEYKPAFKSNEAYKNAFKNKYTTSKNEGLRSTDAVEFNYYIISATKLGWINCDRFYQSPGEKVDYLVEIDLKSNPQVKLVFEDIQSVMAGEIRGNMAVFPNVPKGQKVKVVAISFDDDKPRLAVVRTTTGSDMLKGLKYKPFSLDQLEAELK